MPETLVPEATDTAESFLTRAFDKVAPLPKGQEKAPESIKVVEPAKVEPVKVAEPAKTEDKPLPSFLDKPVIEPEKKEEVEIDWPEELPEVKDEKKQADYKKWRAQYKDRGDKLAALNAENEELKKRTGADDPQIQERIKQLETENTGYKEKFDKVYVESSDWFQQTFVQPRQSAVARAKQIVQEVGGDPQAVDKVLTLQGKGYWDALEELSRDLPEAAKISLNQLVTGIQQGDQKRDQVLSQSKENANALREQELTAQRQRLDQDKTFTKTMLQDLISDMRGRGLEVLQRTTDPKEAWWNSEIVDKIEKGAEETLLNADPKRLIASVLLGHSADQYRTMFLGANQKVAKLEKELADIRKAEPNLEETGGAQAKIEDDAKKPLASTFRSLLEKERSKRS